MSWTKKNDRLVNEFSFENFKQALAFVNKTGDLAEMEQHHPDIYIHDYNKVRIELSTHDEGNMVTEKDRDLASKIDKL
ncbi:MAG: 4a-hydroxytetrahydrobiopterin dehydratase [Brumimicrobium sp.]|nr:4a-hydroxytetrahydrobiopterin dehydratase [Brumimicrobium sp.]